MVVVRTAVTGIVFPPGIPGAAHIPFHATPELGIYLALPPAFGGCWAMRVEVSPSPAYAHVEVLDQKSPSLLSPGKSATAVALEVRCS